MAKRLDISNQAVSKWETEQSYPDIELLPKIADIFDITLDELFGRKFEQEKDVLDWQDDTLYAVVFRGSKLIRRDELDENLNQICNNITLEYSGEIRNIELFMLTWWSQFGIFDKMQISFPTTLLDKKGGTLDSVGVCGFLVPLLVYLVR